jgi:signal peptidase I
MEPRRQSSILRDYAELLLVAFVLLNYARVFLFQAFKIPSGSMYDNLLVGDHIIVNKFIYGPGPAPLPSVLPATQIHRCDVIVFRSPENPNVDFVKRVIALPGEILEIRDKKVFLNGRELNEPYKIHVDHRTIPNRAELPEVWRSRDQFGPVRVPHGSYFVMGDNRDRSSDSRYWGFVPRTMVAGRAFLIYWSFRGAPSTANGKVSSRLEELTYVLRHFLSRTRWNRTCRVIDSSYHYDEPERGE